MTNRTYRIYIHSNEHPHTPNTSKTGRTNYSVIEVEGRDAAIEKIKELRREGKEIYEVLYGFSGYHFNHENIK